MLTTHYLFHNSYSLTTKNKLEAAIAEYLKSLSGTLVYKHEVEDFKNAILIDIEELNQQHARCKKVTPSWGKTEINDKPERVALYGVHFITCVLLGGMLKVLKQEATDGRN